MLKNMFGLVNNTPSVPLKTPQQPKKITKSSDSTISTEKEDKMTIYYKLLETMCSMLDDNQIPFYLDCGTLLGCIR